MANSSKRGLLTVIAIFVFGSMFLAGLYLTAWSDLTPEYRASVVGVPPRTLAIVAAGADVAIDDLRRLGPDFVLFPTITRKKAQDIAISLDMRYGGQIQMYFAPYASGHPDGPSAAILSRHPLHKGRSITKGGSDHFGIWVEAIVDGKRFLVGAAAFSSDSAPAQLQRLLESWRKAGQPPLIVGGAVPIAANPASASPLRQSDGFLYSDTWMPAAPATAPSASPAIQWLQLVPR